MSMWRKSTHSDTISCLEAAAWRKSTHSASTNCVELGQTWRKSSYSGSQGGNCVDAGSNQFVIGIRDTKEQHDAQRTTLLFSPQEWRRFTAEVRASAPR